VFTEKDIAVKEVRDEMIEKFDRMATPLAVIGGRMFWGFTQNRTEIEKLIKDIKK